VSAGIVFGVSDVQLMTRVHLDATPARSF
jgi:hypothetical protein